MIRQKDLTIIWVLFALSVVFLMTGALVFNGYSGTGGVVTAVLAALCFVGIFRMTRTKTCCPHCGGWLRFDEVQYRAKRGYHCTHCGSQINISKE